MSTKPTMLVTENSMMVIGQMSSDEVRLWVGWLEEHGLPNDVLADHPVTRDTTRNTIAYVNEVGDYDSDPVVIPAVADADHHDAWKKWMDDLRAGLGAEGEYPEPAFWPLTCLEVRVVYLDRPPAPFPFPLTEFNSTKEYPRWALTPEGSPSVR